MECNGVDEMDEEAEPLVEDVVAGVKASAWMLKDVPLA
jgi:hypothetical protein